MPDLRRCRPAVFAAIAQTIADTCSRQQNTRPASFANHQRAAMLPLPAIEIQAPGPGSYPHILPRSDFVPPPALPF